MTTAASRKKEEVSMLRRDLERAQQELREWGQWQHDARYWKRKADAEIALRKQAKAVFDALINKLFGQGQFRHHHNKFLRACYCWSATTSRLSNAGDRRVGVGVLIGVV